MRCFAVMLTVALSLSTMGDTWRRYAYASEGFSAVFPGKVQVVAHSASFNSFTVQYTTYFATDPPNRCTVLTCALPKGASQEVRDRFTSSIEAGFTRSFRNASLIDGFRTIHSVPGHYLKLSRPDVEIGLWSAVVKGRLYVVTYATTPARFAQMETHVLDGFSILP